jgi:AraC family transcriptional regulator
VGSATIERQLVTPQPIVRTGRPGNPDPFGAVPVVASGDLWTRMKMAEYCRSPGEEYQGTPTEHLVVLNLGPAYRRERTWTDQGEVQRHTFEHGHLAIIPAWTHLRTRWLDASHALILQIDPALLVETARVAFRDVAPVVHLRRELNARDEFLSHLMLALRDVLKEDHRSARSYGDHLAIAVAMHLVNRYATNAPGGSVQLAAGLPVNRMRRVAQHIEFHLDAPLSLRELARVANNMSVFHFARLFKARTGLSPHQYVLRKRVERAKQLLGDGSLTIAEIAARCGFSHQPHFTKAFHQFAGATPMEWRVASLHLRKIVTATART